MAEKLKLELQDENGNVYHLHTSADIVFLEDGTTVEAALTKKVTAAGGDIANTIISAIDASTASFPVPAAKDKPRTFLGKIKKWQEDCIAKFGNYVLKSMISSQQINDSSKVPSSALAYLMQQAITENANDISVLNTNLDSRVVIGDLVYEADRGANCRRIVYCNNTTLNTPYKDELTDSSEGTAYINMSNKAYGTILFIVSGWREIFLKYKNNNIWNKWERIYPAQNIPEAVLSDDLFGNYYLPTFVRWNSTETINTPNSAGLTNAGEGWAIVYGDTTSGYQSVYAWTKDTDEFYAHVLSNKVDYGWSSFISKEKIQTLISGMISDKITKDYFATQDFTINFGSVASNSYPSKTLDVTKSNYTPIGVILFSITGDAYYTALHKVRERFENNNYIVQIENMGTNTVTNTNVSVRILYKLNS